MSIAQPSANQIANIYQGNPGALNARIQQEQKGKPAGLPPDLTKLMALNIDVNEQDAAKRAQAMQALQSMQQQGGGEPPTVAQTIQQQAMQKAQIMQQQMQQMQPKPQGLMALLQSQAQQSSPENAPRPNRQPSGIDELSSNVGEHFDGGGIVAFDGTKGSKVEDPKSESSQFVQDIAKIPEAFDELKQRAREEDARKAEQDRRMEQYRQDVLAAKQKTSLFNYLFGSPTSEKEGLQKLAELSSAPPATKAERPAAVPSAPMDAESQKLANLAASRADTGVNTNPALKPAAPAPANKPSIVNLLPNQQPPKPAAPPAPPAPSAPAAPTSPYDKILASAMQDPTVLREEAIQRMAKFYGEPDTAAQEKYIKQLDESRSRFAEPEDFAGRLSRWARNTAAAGGRSSLETGAKGAAATYAEQQANAQRNMEILKELMGETSKVADIKRNYKKELFGFGEKTYDDAFKTGLEAAKEMGLDRRQAELFAHQSAEKALDRANAIRVAGMPGAEQKEFMSIAQDWLKKPENAGKSLSDAFAYYATAKQGFRPEQSRAGLIEKYASDWNKMDYMEKSNLKKEGVNTAEDYINRMLRITEQTKPGATTAGAPITKAQYDALPKGASYTAPDGSQRIKG